MVERQQVWGIVIGGLVPALLYGVGGIFQKFSVQAGIGIGPYILSSGLGAVLAGVLICALVPDRAMTGSGSFYAMLIGFIWALGMSMVAIALVRYSTPLAKLAPLYNMNTLVTVVLALFLFAEWKELSIGRLLTGTVFIIIGCTLVSRS